MRVPGGFFFSAPVARSGGRDPRLACTGSGGGSRWRDARLQGWRRRFATYVGWDTDEWERPLQTLGMEIVVATQIMGLDRLRNGVLLYFEDGTIAFYPQTLLHAMATQVIQIDAEETSPLE